MRPRTKDASFEIISKRGAVAKFNHVSGFAHHLAFQRFRLQEPMTVAAQDRRLFLVPAEQQHDSLLAGADVPAPIGAQGGTPHRNGAEKSVLAAAPSDQQQETPQRAAFVAVEQSRASSARFEQFELAWFAERDAVNQLGDNFPRPKARGEKVLPNNVGWVSAWLSVIIGRNGGASVVIAPLKLDHLLGMELLEQAACFVQADNRLDPFSDPKPRTDAQHGTGNLRETGQIDLAAVTDQDLMVDVLQLRRRTGKGTNKLALDPAQIAPVAGAKIGFDIAHHPGKEPAGAAGAFKRLQIARSKGAGTPQPRRNMRTRLPPTRPLVRKIGN